MAFWFIDTGSIQSSLGKNLRRKTINFFDMLKSKIYFISSRGIFFDILSWKGHVPLIKSVVVVF